MRTFSSLTILCLSLKTKKLFAGTEIRKARGKKKKQKHTHTQQNFKEDCLLIFQKKEFLPSQFHLATIQVHWTRRKFAKQPTHVSLCLFWTQLERKLHYLLDCCWTDFFLNYPLNHIHAHKSFSLSLCHCKLWGIAMNRFLKRYHIFVFLSNLRKNKLMSEKLVHCALLQNLDLYAEIHGSCNY